MSVSPGMAAGQAGGYFSMENYYLHGKDLDENSLWGGRGSRELGQEGPVREEEFRALCRGKDPAGTTMVMLREVAWSNLAATIPPLRTSSGIWRGCRKRASG